MSGKLTGARIDRLIRARYPLIAVQSHEETRVIDHMRTIAVRQEKQLYTWSISRGIERLTRSCDEYDFEPGQFADPVEMLNHILDTPDDKAIFVLKDMHPFIAGDHADPVVVRALRDVAAELVTRHQTVILLSPSMQPPADAEKDIAIVDFPLPNTEELSEHVDNFIANLPVSIPVHVNGDRSEITRALQGLTATEADAVLAQAVLELGHVGLDVIPYILEAKAEIIRSSGALEYYPEQKTYSDIGGLDLLKRWCKASEIAFSPEAQAFGVEADRGALIVGVPGCGKSLTAKAVAGGRRPLLRLDVGALFGSLVGQSESQTRNALKIAEAVAPAVLWIDECEKALGSAGGELDGGTSQRVLGTILTWMEETEAPVFVVATANDISTLRPELIRRFSETFFVDLPQRQERIEILQIHVSKRGRNPEAFDLEQVADATEQFTGSELEKIVQIAIKTAFLDGARSVTTDDLLAAAAQTVPLATTMADKIAQMREWSRRARPASSRQQVARAEPDSRAIEF